MTPDWQLIFTWVAMIAIAAYMLWRTNKPVGTADIANTAKEAAPLAQELATVANMAVMAAEQYMRTGKLQSNDEALKFAITFVKRWIPVSRGFTEDDILTAIHSFVPVANALTKQLTDAANPATPHAQPTSAPDKPLILGR